MAVADASIYTDFAGLAQLKAQAGRDQDAALDEVARQFEALFLQQMIKEMRNASFGGGLFDSDQTQFYQQMYDQQLALHLTKGGGIGLAEVLKRQLGGAANAALQPRQGLDGFPLVAQAQAGLPLSGALQGPMPLDNRIHPGLPKRRPVTAANGSGQATSVESAGPLTRSRQTPAKPAAAPPTASAEGFASPEDFVRSLRPHARDAAARLGVDADVLIAQAALESGWGRRQISHADGRSAHNLFGIKADRRWQGDKVTVPTLEYEGGVAVRKREPFRAYASYRESFLDYANFILSNPRYGNALRVADDPRAYYRELQKAGYATDPKYADKLTAILQSKPLRGGSKAL